MIVTANWKGRERTGQACVHLASLQLSSWPQGWWQISSRCGERCPHQEASGRVDCRQEPESCHVVLGVRRWSCWGLKCRLPHERWPHHIKINDWLGMTATHLSHHLILFLLDVVLVKPCLYMVHFVGKLSFVCCLERYLHVSATCDGAGSCKNVTCFHKMVYKSHFGTIDIIYSERGENADYCGEKNDCDECKNKEVMASWSQWGSKQPFWEKKTV